MKPIHVILYTLLTLLLVFILFVFLVFVIIKGVTATKPSVSSNSTLIININGDIPEYQPEGGLPIKSKKSTTIKTIVDNIDKAKVDDRVKGILLRVNMNFMGWAKIDEIKNKLDDFKQSGKYVIAYLGSFVSEKEYFLALSADSIFAVPGGFMEMNGLVIETVHSPGMFEKIGIDIDYYAFGKYKSRSGESMGRKTHTEPVLEMLNDLLDWEYNHLVTGIAEKLNISSEEVKATIDKGYFNPEKFAEIGWIDGLLYEDQLEERLKQLNGIDADRALKEVTNSQYAGITMESLGLNKGKNKIALIYSQGLIQEGDDSFSPLSMGMTAGTDPMITAIKRAAKRKSVKAIVFRVDSPGGSGLGCDLVWREILKAKKEKPVIVSMSDYAASGGYWVSMGATAIVAQPSTLTGSIGVWGIFPNFSGFFDKLGLTETVVKRGDHADMLLAMKEMTPYERNLYRENVRSTYVDFVTKAAESRGMTYEKLEPYAQGRSWMGEQAKKWGLVDDLGGLERAIELAREKAEIDSTEDVKVVVYSVQKPWFEKVLSGGVLSWLVKDLDLQKLQNKWQEIVHNRRPLIWPLLPHQLQIQ